MVLNIKKFKSKLENIFFFKSYFFQKWNQEKKKFISFSIKYLLKFDKFLIVFKQKP
jgi:hypothetical protein